MLMNQTTNMNSLKHLFKVAVFHDFLLCKIKYKQSLEALPVSCYGCCHGAPELFVCCCNLGNHRTVLSANKQAENVIDICSDSLFLCTRVL